ncbi:MAG: aminoglycoside 6-adenylyltransferase [Planctomycetaceae bacterium]
MTTEMSHAPDPKDRERIIERFTELCERDERIVAAFLGGSLARDADDRFSDLDLCIVFADAALRDIEVNRAAMIAELGTPLFLEDWGEDDPVLFAILADGTEIELHRIPEGRLREVEVGPIRPLLDRGGILAGLELPLSAPHPDELRDECRRLLAWFWHDVAHTVAAIGRGQLWWAHGQVEALRGYCVNVVRLEQRSAPGGEPYWKIEEEIAVASLAPLAATIVPLDRAALTRAASELVAFFGAHGRRAAEAYDLPYPDELERLMLRELDAVADA